MRRIFAMAICAACLASGAKAADVGVSINFSQPGMFGRIDIGQYPQPQVIVARPVIVEPLPPAMPPPEPIYLWVPPEHRQHWEKHCHEYHACGQPVYFVNHVWYKNHVLAREGRPQGRHADERHGEHGRAEEERGRHKGHDDEDRGHDHGRGHD